MLHLQKLLLPVRRPAFTIHLPLHRALLSTATATATAPSPDEVAVEDYLVTTCGLTREQAAKATKFISHRKVPSNADAVLAFLAGPELGLSPADIASLVSSDPRILNCRVDTTLGARVDGIRRHGFSTAQIRSLVRAAPHYFRMLNVDEKLGFWISFLGSAEKVLFILKRNGYIVTAGLGLIKTNVQLLQESGLSAHDIAYLCVANSRLLTSQPDCIRAILRRADGLGVPRDSLLFKQAVAVAAGFSPETISTKLKFLGDMLGLSDAEVARVAQTSPQLLTRSCQTLQRQWEFLTKVVGFDPKFILERPTILMYSLERRLAPRYYVMKKLLEKELIPKDKGFYAMVTIGNELFHSRENTHLRRAFDVPTELNGLYRQNNCGGVAV
ncbi:hypothetical protein ACP4OV_000295 [Aristida adscensionis]